MGSTTLRIWRLAAYLAFTIMLMPVQMIGLLLGCRWVATFPVFYHRCCCRIMGLRVRAIGQPAAARPVLFASNHTSYLDITVLGSQIPGSFVAKTEVSRWPLFGLLAKLQRSVFVDRKVRTTAQQRDAISERLAAKDVLILFPEGTSGDGNRVLPFKSALFSVAAHPEQPVVVQPVSVTYTRLDGMPIGRRYRPLFAWYGDMALAPHLWRVIGLGKVEIVVEYHPPTSYAACGSRKALSQYCYDHIANGVSAALTGRRELVEKPARTEGHEKLGGKVAAPAIG